jgi:hypothetical protein
MYHNGDSVLRRHHHWQAMKSVWESPTLETCSYSANQDISRLYWTRRNMFTVVFLLSLSEPDESITSSYSTSFNYIFIPSLSRTPNWFFVEVFLSRCEKKATSASFPWLSFSPCVKAVVTEMVNRGGDEKCVQNISRETWREESVWVILTLCMKTGYDMKLALWLCSGGCSGEQLHEEGVRNKGFGYCLIFHHLNLMWECATLSHIISVSHDGEGVF